MGLGLGVRISLVTDAHKLRANVADVWPGFIDRGSSVLDTSAVSPSAWRQHWPSHWHHWHPHWRH
jgi:hypothetical protein